MWWGCKPENGKPIVYLPFSLLIYLRTHKHAIAIEITKICLQVKHVT